MNGYKLDDFLYKNEPFRDSKFSYIPIKLLIIITISVFASQLVAIILFSIFYNSSLLLWSVFNVALLVVIIFSSIYCFCFLPFMKNAIDLSRINKLLYCENIELQQAFQNISDGVCMIDKDYRIIHYNQSFLMLSGLDENKIASKKCYEIFPGEYCHTDYCSIKRTLCDNKRFMFKENKLRIDGKRIPCIINVIPFQNHKGELIGVIEEVKYNPINY